MLKNTLMAVPLASVLAVMAPGTFQQPQAAQFPRHLGTSNTLLLDLVQDRFEPGGGGRGGDRGGADRGGGDRGTRGGGGETRPLPGDGGGRSMNRENSDRNRDRNVRRDSGDGDRDRNVRRDRGDGDRDRSVRRNRGDGDRDGYNRRDGRYGDRGDRRRFHRGKRHVWGPGVEFWFYDGYYHGDCDWLREKANDTGSRYWWTRYRLCRDWS
jgi:hypothetical protein